jgi:preprotein translocase subunit YajC
MEAILASPIIYFALMIGLFYLFIFVPENKRKKKYGSMLTNLKVNDNIMTRGGIIGKIVNIQDKFIILETGPDKMRIKLDKNGISHVLADTVEENKEIDNK